MLCCVENDAKAVSGRARTRNEVSVGDASAFGSSAQSGSLRAMWNGWPQVVKLVKRQARRRKEIKVKTFQRNQTRWSEVKH